jgi:hypothetical protein
MPPVTCMPCATEVSGNEAIELPCHHAYCRGCLTRHVRNAMIREVHFPPRCCTQVISENIIDGFLSEEMVSSYREKQLEYSIPAAQRVYCHRPTCSAIIPPVRGAAAVTCRKCGSSTCVACKNGHHDGRCPEDESTAQLLGVARRRGWMRCSRCRNMIERIQGCFHISKSRVACCFTLRDYRFLT